MLYRHIVLQWSILLWKFVKFEHPINIKNVLSLYQYEF